MATLDQYSNLLLALAIWREARSQDRQAMLGVKHVILNRVAHPAGPYARCPDVVSTILCPYQFSSFNVEDPNATRLPNPKYPNDWMAWEECCAVVDSGDPDPTGGANYYFSVGIVPPNWAEPSKFTVQIGAFRFYKL